MTKVIVYHGIVKSIEGEQIIIEFSRNSERFEAVFHKEAFEKRNLCYEGAKIQYSPYVNGDKIRPASLFFWKK